MNNSLTDGIASLASSSIYNADTANSSTTVSMDDFLKIMSATMSNPSMDDSGSSGGGSSTDYMTSLAQYESLNTLMEMNKSLSASVAVQQQQEALGMLGKQVSLLDNGQQVSGKVEQVKFANGLATLVVNGQEYQMSSLSEVGEDK
ncbi:MAG: flagellar basal body rod modification protein [Liquorilactobacillus ghanensis]|uniref:Flagellar basal-body rod modification protein FlgD n=2 Tax=Liquorilactobacillus ghanensis TaxID=399370 RepID=A0A0R1VST2_9LACO|nr:flagellar basal body rod modification protein [Liquorilactobacillus ghanensis]AJA34004.1 flagellar basal-body rod modification protein FlgD [Liquorilactobacillus ghanensis]KRM05955.1 hypothetical protein FC89_GL000819 [Liquorilactobacillus ghanensis DSM 18630]